MTGGFYPQTGEGKFVVKRVESNLVIAWVDPSVAHPDQVVEDLQAGEVTVLGMTFTNTNFRLAFHLDISDQLAVAAREKMAAVIRKLLGKGNVEMSPMKRSVASPVVPTRRMKY